MLDLQVSSRHVQRILSSHPHLSFQKMMATPVLTKNRKKIQVQWARKCVTLARTDWNEILFSEEKKFPKSCRCNQNCHKFNSDWRHAYRRALPALARTSLRRRRAVVFYFGPAPILARRHYLLLIAAACVVAALFLLFLSRAFIVPRLLLFRGCCCSAAVVVFAAVVVS